MAEDFDGLNAWLDDIKKAVTLTTAQKAVITSAGAAAFAEVLKRNTPRSKRNKTEHLADMITYKPGFDIEGNFTGNTDVGFKKSKAYIARFLNDGTKKMSATHFFDKTVDEALVAAQEAEAAAYYTIVGGGLD
ncbi:hypothetical protein IV38_GL001959 [Lactobacillus selangorensis]|uniref:Uncharacterized protein n=1 Tax=Lactobacillus selangorensis TaxID=81857 RepID=A0A0R2FP30_9LACO|nr:HK97-gp10 family putative phage morphogenesis protein [Lactobacillus selangorensis]KRN27745.1 hypothetical protein IV38_GL001959 [Lactobacillus selangorensis]KRN30290.1 hypothetical protein IV40_GL001878 [Lactobacillus selangorensis]